MAGNADELDALRAELGGSLPGGLDVLPADRLHHLTTLIRAAKERQERLIDEGADAALSLVPRPLRGPVRRALRA
jgi:hypothetical protein